MICFNVYENALTNARVIDVNAISQYICNTISGNNNAAAMCMDKLLVIGSSNDVVPFHTVKLSNELTIKAVSEIPVYQLSNQFNGAISIVWATLIPVSLMGVLAFDIIPILSVSIFLLIFWFIIVGSLNALPPSYVILQCIFIEVILLVGFHSLRRSERRAWADIHVKLSMLSPKPSHRQPGHLRDSRHLSMSNEFSNFDGSKSPTHRRHQNDSRTFASDFNTTPSKIPFLNNNENDEQVNVSPNIERVETPPPVTFEKTSKKMNDEPRGSDFDITTPLHKALENLQKLRRAVLEVGELRYDYTVVRQKNSSSQFDQLNTIGVIDDVINILRSPDKLMRPDIMKQLRNHTQGVDQETGIWLLNLTSQTTTSNAADDLDFDEDTNDENNQTNESISSNAADSPRKGKFGRNRRSIGSKFNSDDLSDLSFTTYK